MTARARTGSLTMVGPMALLATAAMVLTGLVPAPAHAQSPQGVGVVTSLSGQASVARAAAPTVLRLNFKDDVFERDRISTAEKSVVRILLGGKAVITVRELSQLTITEEVGRATVNLTSGKIAMSVLRSRMKPGEVIEVHTPNAVAAVRGTVLMAESIPGADGGDHISNFGVWRGAIEVSASTDTGVVVRVATQEGVRVVGRNVGMPQTLSPQALAKMWQGLDASPQHSDAPDGFMTMLGDQERGRALAQARRWLASLRHHGRGNGVGRGQGQGQGQANDDGAGAGGNRDDRGSDGPLGPSDQTNGAAGGASGNAGGGDGSGAQGGLALGLGSQGSGGGQGFGGAGQIGSGGGLSYPGLSNAIHGALNALLNGRGNRGGLGGGNGQGVGVGPGGGGGAQGGAGNGGGNGNGGNGGRGGR